MRLTAWVANAVIALIFGALLFFRMWWGAGAFALFFLLTAIDLALNFLRHILHELKPPNRR